MSSNKAVGSQRWFQAWRSGPRRTPDHDPADLGTCFGLELSLSEPAPLATPGPEKRPGWVRRLTGRRRVSA